MFKFDIYYIIEILVFSITFNSKKSINFFGDMASYTSLFKNKNYQKASFNCAKRCWMLHVPM